MPVSDFGKWLAQETLYLVIAPKGGMLYEYPADARMAWEEAGEDQ